MRMTLRLAASTIVLTIIAAANAHADVSCPDRLAVEQKAEVPANWSVGYSEVPPRLAGVTFFDGPPANGVSLKFDRSKRTGKELVQTWNLPDSPRNHYLQCSYERTTATISTPLPRGVRFCEIVYDASTTYAGGAMPVKRMFCR